MSPTSNSIFTFSVLTALAAAASLPSEPARLDTRATARLQFGNVPYGTSLKSCVQPNMMALTFDDGPGQYTSHVLDLLERAGNIKATFFLNGRNGANGMSVQSLSPLLNRMIDSGHQLASHSFSHKNFDQISEEEQTQELLLNEKAFADAIGMIPTYFRPPYTACGPTCLATANKLAYHVADYDLDTKDYEGNEAASKSRFLEGVSQAPRSWVALAHDIHQLTAKSITPYMIEQARARGYRFVTIGECMGDPQSNWYRDPHTGRAVGGNNNIKPVAPISSSSTLSSATSSTSSISPSSSSSSTSPSSTSSPSASESSTSRSGNNAATNNTLPSATRATGAPATTATATEGGAMGSWASGSLAWSFTMGSGVLLALLA